MLGICSLLLPFSAQATIYIYVGANGDRIVTDSPMQKSGYHLLHSQQTFNNVGNILAGREDSSTFDDHRQSYDGYIQTASEKFRLDPALVKAIIQVESNFNPQAVSRKGARGLMQLMPETAARYNEYNLFSPLSNITVGSHHLSYLLARYSQNETLALAAYNAGEDVVDRYQGIPPFKETQLYVKRVMQYHKRYRSSTTETKL
jgi:soluble lytic murein transglycosylase-like protein